MDAELRSAIMGQIDTNTTHDCTRYSWWKKHEGSSTHRDRTCGDALRSCTAIPQSRFLPPPLLRHRLVLPMPHAPCISTHVE